MHSSQDILQELLPGASELEISSALEKAGGDVEEAAQSLLGDASDDDIGTVESSVLNLSGQKNLSPKEEFAKFCESSVDTLCTRQLFRVNRIDGISDLRRDIMGIYKNPRTNLKACPRIVFEDEDGVGNGPLREFLQCAMKTVDEGICAGSGKPMPFFEGQYDHRLPIHDQALRLTGSFKAVGRIIGHCSLHGGPPLYGISNAVLDYWKRGDPEDPLHIVLEDLADIDLRDMISELQSLSKDEAPKEELRASLSPYLFEAGLDPDILISDRRLLVDGLLMYHVIDKRRMELDDIGKGMDDISLLKFLSSTPSAMPIIFPREAARCIRGIDMKNLITYDGLDECENNKEVAGFFDKYIDELQSRTEGVGLVDLCCFWMGGNSLPVGLTNENIVVKFDGGAKELPMSETCFLSIILPTQHKEYQTFKNKMDVALKYGSKGFSFS